VKQSKAISITWLHPTHFKSAVQMNADAGLIHQDFHWFKRLYKNPDVFSMGVFSGDELVGWCTYRKTTTGIEILWIIVPDANRGNHIGSMMLERMKGWMANTIGRRGALTCSVHQYADDLLYFLRDRGFECLKINPENETYRMVWIGESKVVF